MILVYIRHIEESENLLQSALHLSINLKKTLGILRFVSSESEIEAAEKSLHDAFSSIDAQIFVRKGNIEDLSEFCEKQEASFLLMQLVENKTKEIQSFLNSCRSLRIPYILFKNSFAELSLTKVLVPVCFLEEELEKAQFASAFGRFYNSEIMLLQANDYGSKAATTVDKMKSLFDKFSLDYQVEKAKSDSFKVDREAIQKAESEDFGIILISASREYGLDDIFFGPKERKLVKESSLPILLVNPRGDLYALCD